MDRQVEEVPEALSLIQSVLDEHLAVAQAMYDLGSNIAAAAALICEALNAGGRVLLCGNGGSAADAQHLAAELTGRFLRERQALPAIALHANTSTLTAIGNDYGYDEVFARPLVALGQAGDVLIAITTSGNSPSILRAAEVARDRKLKVIGLTGALGGKLKDLSDLCLCVPSQSMPRIQEMHIWIGHTICQLVEDNL